MPHIHISDDCTDDEVRDIADEQRNLETGMPPATRSVPAMSRAMRNASRFRPLFA